MFFLNTTNIFLKCQLTNRSIAFRYVRSIVRRGDGPKLVQGKVKTVTQYDESENIKTYKDLVRSVRESKLGDELEIEKSFLDESIHGHVFENFEKYCDMHSREEKRLKSYIKKNIIGRKYFKLDRETNLLTHAAKQQIRFLHSLNPLEWNYKALSECFPISEAGVKKLLKCNFVLTSPEKIKAHDEEVARKWEILKSGKFSDEITPLTQKLYKDGKLVDDYFSGNPNLPTAPSATKKVIEIKKKELVGEFYSIVKTHHDYEKKKSLGSKESDGKEVSVIDKNLVEKVKKNNSKIKNVSKFKVASEEYDDDDDINANPEVYPNIKKKREDYGEIPFSQFKEILKEESETKLNSKYENEYHKFVQQQISKTDQTTVPGNQRESQSCFVKISKYEKENVDLMFEKDHKTTRIYKYDENVGYQYPTGKSIKGKIHVSPKHYKKGQLIKIGKCIYDENGEFLCKVPC